jgi:hypothetical protein
MKRARFIYLILLVIFLTFLTRPPAPAAAQDDDSAFEKVRREHEWV